LERLNTIVKLTAVLLATVLLLLGCSPSPRYHSGLQSSPQKGKSTGKTSAKKPAKHDKSKKVSRGISSYYGPKFHGKLTANGEIFDMYGVTAAHKTMPFNTYVRVTNEDNGKTLIVRINDRGPYIDGRILDCSFGAAKKLGFISEGTAPVKIEVIEWGDGEYMHH